MLSTSLQLPRVLVAAASLEVVVAAVLLLQAGPPLQEAQRIPVGLYSVRAAAVDRRPLLVSSIFSSCVIEPL